MSSPDTTWNDAEAFQSYGGRWSRYAGRELLDWLEPDPNLSWLDVGCGTGSLVEAILTFAEPADVTGVDQSEEYLSYAESKFGASNVNFQLGNAEDLDVADSAFDVVTSGLLLNFLDDPLAVVKEMKRVVVPGGIVAGFVWDYGPHTQFVDTFWKAAAKLDPQASELDEATRFPLCKPEPLRELLTEGGLDDVVVEKRYIATPFENFNDYWEPFLGGQCPAPRYCASLSEQQQLDLREHLRFNMRFDPKGRIRMYARLWAFRGIKS